MVVRKRMPNLPVVLTRTRLEDIMDRAIEYRFMLVNGSPGQGKTSLVANYLQKSAYNVFWYQIDDANANSAQFMEDLAEFLRYFPTSPEIEDEPQYSYPYPAASELDYPAFIEFLKGFTPLGAELFIVIDDYHLIKNADGFDKLLEYMVDNAPACFHFIIISRDEPEWDLAQRKVRREMLRIGNEQIAFTLGEIRDFFREIHHINLNCGQVSTVSEIVGGWTPVMILLAEKITTEPEILNQNIDSILGNLPELSQFIEQEIYSNLTPDQKEVLLSISHVSEEIPSELVNLICGEEGETVLRDLVRECFLISHNKGHLSDEYKLHPLLSSFLRQRADEIWENEKVTGLHCKIGKYYFELEQWSKAIDHFLKGQDLEMAIEVLKNSGPEILNYALSDRLHALVNLPSTEIKDDPWLQFAFACAVRFRDPALCHNYITQALKGFRANNDAKGELQALCLNTEVLILFPGDLHLMQKLLDNNGPQGSKELSNTRIQAYKNVYAAMSHCWLTGNLNEAIRLGEKARWTSHLLKDINLRLWAYWALILAASFMGKFNIAQRRIAEALEIVDSPEITDGIVDVFIPYVAGLSNVFSGNFDIAAEFLEEAYKIASKSKMEGLIFFINNYASCSALYRGDYKLCEKLLDDMGDILGMCMREGNDHLSSYFCCWRGHYMFVRGRYHEAVALGRQALRQRERAGGEVYFVECNLVLGSSLTETGNYQEAEKHLLEALRISTDMGSIFFQASAYLQLAILYDILAEKELHTEYLDKALGIAMENRYKHFFMWKDDRMERVINLMHKNESYSSYADELGKRLKNKKEIAEPDRRAVIEKISKRTETDAYELKMSMLGPLIVEVKGVLHEHLGLKKPNYLLALLAAKSTPINMDVIIEEMWPERDAKLAKDNFHFTLNRLRKFLGIDGIISLKDGICSINTEKLWVDIQQFNELNERAAKLIVQDRKQEAVDVLKESSKLYRGELLEGEFLGPLLMIDREALAKKDYDSLVTLGKVLLSMNRNEEAAGILTAASTKSFADENSFRLLMLAHYSMGNKAAALKTYKRLEEYLATELDTSPHQKTEQLRGLIKDEKEQQKITDIFNDLLKADNLED